MPSGFNRLALWKAMVTRRVLGPKIPSIVSTFLTCGNVGIEGHLGFRNAMTDRTNGEERRGASSALNGDLAVHGRACIQKGIVLLDLLFRETREDCFDAFA